MPEQDPAPVKKNNPFGLRLDYRIEGDGVRADFIAEPRHQGWPGFVHGGMLAFVIDEAAGRCVAAAGLNCVTARMQIKLVKMAPIGETLTVSAAVIKNVRRLVETAVEITGADGRPVAKSSVTFMAISPEYVRNGGQGNGEKNAR